MQQVAEVWNEVWSEVWNLVPQMLVKSVTTLELFFFTLLFALPLGMVLAFGRMAKFRPIRWLTQTYLLVMRGTPLMLQLIFFFYATPLASRFGLDRLQVAIVAFIFNYAAYFAEIYRGGIEGIPVGQYEAANVLGFSRRQTFFRIVLPQVVKRILPPMGNEFITLVKDTSLATVIAVEEITALAKKMQASMVSLMPVVVAAVFYLVMNFVVSRGFAFAEKKLSYYR